MSSNWIRLVAISVFLTLIPQVLSYSVVQGVKYIQILHRLNVLCSFLSSALLVITYRIINVVKTVFILILMNTSARS